MRTTRARCAVSEFNRGAVLAFFLWAIVSEEGRKENERLGAARSAAKQPGGDSQSRDYG